MGIIGDYIVDCVLFLQISRCAKSPIRYSRSDYSNQPFRAFPFGAGEAKASLVMHQLKRQLPALSKKGKAHRGSPSRRLPHRTTLLVLLY